MADHDEAKNDGKPDDIAPEAPASAASEPERDSTAPAARAEEAHDPHVAPSNGGGVLAAAAAHGHDDHGHGLAHTTPVALLWGVLAVLMVLTVVTVLVTGVDLGAQGNLVVAMVIATIKAALVVAFFMHIVWDKKLHLILFLTSVLFLILFLSLAVTDRGEYQHDLETYQNLPK